MLPHRARLETPPVDLYGDDEPDEPYPCARCGEPYDETGGDGYGGCCPTCADWQASTVATITAFEQASPYDDFDTETGIGHAPDTPVVETTSVEVTGEDVDDRGSLDEAIHHELGKLGLDQWDGGNTAYDPDGSSMAADIDGTITTRWALITRDDAAVVLYPTV